MSIYWPADLSASAQELWARGAQSTQVRVGDLWVLSWNGEVVGHAVVAAAKPDYALAWPVSLPGEASFSPGLVIEDTPLSVPVTLWPTRETGIGNHLLDRSLGQLLSPDRIRQLSIALDEDDDPGLAFASTLSQDPENSEADRLMIAHWSELCFNSGGAEEGSFVESTKVQRAGGDARIVSEVLGLGLPELRSVMTGTTPITTDQLSALVERLGVESGSLTGSDPLSDVVDDLAHPRFKRDVVARVAETGISEEAIRRSARREFALAARNDGDNLRESKLRDAIGRAGRAAG